MPQWPLREQWTWNKPLFSFITGRLDIKQHISFSGCKPSVFSFICHTHLSLLKETSEPKTRRTWFCFIRIPIKILQQWDYLFIWQQTLKDCSIVYGSKPSSLCLVFTPLRQLMIFSKHSVCQGAAECNASFPWDSKRFWTLLHVWTINLKSKPYSSHVALHTVAKICLGIFY